MKTRSLFWPVALAAALIALLACGGSEPAAPPPVDAEPMIIEWSIGAKGGLGGPGAFITQRVWEPRELDVPVNHPFIIRFVPRDEANDIIVFGNTLKKEVGIDLEDLIVEMGQPVDSPTFIIPTYGKSFDVFSRQYRGTGGYGSLVTPPEPSSN